jgi:hypothetical protein
MLPNRRVAAALHGFDLTRTPFTASDVSDACEELFLEAMRSFMTVNDYLDAARALGATKRATTAAGEAAQGFDYSGR